MSPYDRLLTAAEVAAELRVTKAWVYAETRARRLPHVRLGRYVRYRQTAIDTWIERLEGASTRHLRIASRGVSVSTGSPTPDGDDGAGVGRGQRPRRSPQDA